MPHQFQNLAFNIALASVLLVSGCGSGSGRTSQVPATSPSSTTPATRELTLEDYAGKDLRGLDKRSRDEFLSRFEALTGDKREAAFSGPFMPWRVQPFSAGNAAWVHLEAYPGYDVPDVSGVQVHLFDRNWKRLVKSSFPTGYRLFLNDVEVSRENPLEQDMVVARVTPSGPFIVHGEQKRAAFEQGDFQRQYFAVVSGQVILVRLEDDKGQPIRNNYNWSAPMKGPRVTTHTPEEWIGTLRSSNAAEQLATLVWLSGTHLSSTKERQDGINQENLADSKVFEAVRDAEETKKILRKLSTSMNPWVREYARLGMAEVDN